MKQKGFTLAEVVITILILGILAAMAAPSFRDVIRSNRLTSGANAFLGALNYARSEAVNRNQRVVVCKSDDGQRCNTSRTVGYEQGWMVFVDKDDDAIFDSAGGDDYDEETGDKLLRVQDALPGETTLTSDSTRNSLNDYVAYMGDGRTRAANGRVQNGCLELIDAPESDNPSGRQILINTIGRVRVEEGTCSG